MTFAKLTSQGNRVRVKFRGVPRDDAEAVAYMQDLDAIYAREEPFVILYDASEIGFLSMHHIRMQAEYMHNKEAVTRKYMTRAAVVVKRWEFRLILKTLFKLRKPSAPLEVFTRVEDAKQYLRNAQLPAAHTAFMSDGTDGGGHESSASS
jgi:hypothetical protein